MSETPVTESRSAAESVPAESVPVESEAAKHTVEREVERKLRVPALFTMPLLVGDHTGVARLLARPPITLTATYFDTDDLRLARWGITVRRREGGHDEGWHLKLPVAGAHAGDRDEIRMPLNSGSDTAPPTELTQLLIALVRSAPLRPVATLRTERTPALLRAADERVIAEIVDDVVSVLDGDRVAGRFREIEVEARDGNADDLARIVAVLEAAGAESGTTSKAAHALGPRATAPADVPPPTPPTRRGAASVAVHAHLLTQTRKLLLNDVRMRRDLPDSVHQMRVAARRLRSSLRTFHPLLDAQWADDLRAELGWLAGELGAVRDAEVLLARLTDACQLIDDERVRAATLTVVNRELGRKLVQARADSLAALSSERYVSVLDHVVSSVRVPPFTPEAALPARQVLPQLSAQSWRRLRKEVRGLNHDTAAEHWHRARIIAKRARYAAEAIEPVFGAEATTLAESLEAVTELLGEHQDASVARDVLTSIAASAELTGIEGWGLGLLNGIEVDIERRTREQFPAVWAHARRVHRRHALS